MIVERITESFSSTGTVDPAAGIIRGVKLLGFESVNGRDYPPPVVRAAVSKYESARVNVDHGKQPGEPRSLADRFGVIRSARFVEGRGAYGDLHYNPKHPLAEQVAWAAQHDPRSLGMSHDAFLRLAPHPGKNGRQSVEEIVRVHSVDLVADPATTAGIFESASPMAAMADGIKAAVMAIVDGPDDLDTKIAKIKELLRQQDTLNTLVGNPREIDFPEPTIGINDVVKEHANNWLERLHSPVRLSAFDKQIQEQREFAENVLHHLELKAFRERSQAYSPESFARRLYS